MEVNQRSVTVRRRQRVAGLPCGGAGRVESSGRGHQHPADHRLPVTRRASPAPGRRATLAPHVIVLFGATGDLAKRKLLPGMASLVQSKLAPKIRVVGTSLEDLSEDEFRALAPGGDQLFGSHES